MSAVNHVGAHDNCKRIVDFSDGCTETWSKWWAMCSRGLQAYQGQHVYYDVYVYASINLG